MLRFLSFIGDLYSAREYMRGEFHLTTPQFGTDTAMAIIRVFHDQQTQEEKLLVSKKL